ncbi:nuclear distribution protein nudE homolog 1-like isoform X2 [Nasonia vitripennis]|uniref:Uncharacterized protein n=1 Tax=Nasonia vitripennis TaxID=7425 RepID=A0A7M7H6U0_NASVI|nr:nuclear distribution protein nudE homolog 1-like isoform X2 [Nasonia vitripennis]XP_032455400.1 nuclear distribution protein nudE homolog 1-like isoform X2 [Nasonia vitripennis]
MMEIDAPSNFASKDDEVRYWMDVAQQMCQRNETLESENSQLKLRLSEQMAVQAKFQAQLHEQKRHNDQLLVCIRKLEQQNDDLEKANRESKTAEEELEMQFNSVLEKLALLQTDVEEKEGLKVVVQRLKDENKELKQQIQVDTRQYNSNSRLPMKSEEMQNIAISQVFERMMEFDRPQSKKEMRNMREMEEQVDSLQDALRISKEAQEDIASKFDSAVKKIALLEAELSDKKNVQATIQKLQEENRDLSQEMDVRLRAHKSKTLLERTRSHSISSKLQEEKQRSSAGNRVSRNIENRVKKGKEEEKRQQNLTWFLKRLRYSQPNWMRRKEQN